MYVQAMAFLVEARCSQYVFQNVTLPSMTWTRTTNGTHGIIRAVVDSSNGKPKASQVTAYRARSSDTTK